MTAPAQPAAKKPGPPAVRAAAPPSRGAARQAARERAPRLDRELERRASRGGTSRVIVRLKPGADISGSARGLGGRMGRRLHLIEGHVVELPNAALRALSNHPAVESLHVDRPVARLLNRTTETIGAGLVHRQYGYTGRGIGVAVIDSGITGWHDDLTGAGPAGYPYGNQRVRHFVDLVNGQTEPYDDNGHGTHVAGAVAGNGYDSHGRRPGVAPEADLVVIKALNHLGSGHLSDVIAAFDYAVAMKDAFNIRVINLSIGAGITESYWTDPLTLAARRAVDAGIVVVAAAGNSGWGPDGERYFSISSPANAPWVIAVGAGNHQGTISRHDDTIAPFSSRGPTRGDFLAKPDLVAPGVGLVSLSDPTSYSYAMRPGSLLDGSVSTGYKPYLSLNGTSMAAPVVAGSVALMLEANPDLNPNLVKAILQYTASSQPGIDRMSQGAGFLNTLGAVRLARFFRDASPGAVYPTEPSWSRHIFWGNYRVAGGAILPSASAWDDNIVWGHDTDNIVWGMDCGDAACDNIVWGHSFDDNIVWGLNFDNIVWGHSSDDNIVWGHDVDNIVWGMNCGGADCDNIVWGHSFDDNIVWGHSFDDNIVWGHSFDDNIVWGHSFDDNIVWGHSFDDNIVWGHSSDDNIVWGFGAGRVGLWNPSEEVDPASVTEAMVFGAPALPEPPVGPPAEEPAPVDATEEPAADIPQEQEGDPAGDAPDEGTPAASDDEPTAHEPDEGAPGAPEPEGAPEAASDESTPLDPSQDESTEDPDGASTFDAPQPDGEGTDGQPNGAAGGGL